MISQLSTPISVETPYGPVSATHEAFGFTHHAAWSGRMQSHRVLGKLDDTGKFIAFPGTEENVVIEGADLNALQAPNAQGKKVGQFRTDDVIAKHQEIRTRTS